MKKIIILIIVLLAYNTMNAQTFNGNGGPIPSTGTPAYYSINVGTLGSAICDTNFGIVKIGINITHPDDIEVEVALIAPDGTVVILTSGNGVEGDNYTNTFFDDRANVYISAGIAPFTGTFRPNEILGSVNNGQPANGVWKLFVLDNYSAAYTGTLLNWSLTFGNNATGPDSTFTSSNLPIVILNTYGHVIPDEPKISAGLKIINNGPGLRNYITDPPQYEGNSGVERRGSTAQYFSKKSYGLETWDASGNDIDTSLLGMPSENDWILNASFSDKSLMRNVLAYQVWQNLGHYSTRYQFVELVINGLYKGVYVFSEKIKRNKNRVDIAKLKPNANARDSLTGGYIFKIDKTTGSGGYGWTSPYPPSSHIYNQKIYFQYEYPDETAITSPQKLYIMDYVDDFETALHGSNFADTVIGFRKYAIEGTFIDYFLENEISKNVDSYRLSTFLHKQRDSKGGKLRMGPVWDYDLAWHNANFCGGDLTTGWAYQFPCPEDAWQVPFWWSKLLTDTLYASHLKCRWQYLRQNILSDGWFDNYIDSTAAQLDEAQQRNFITWPVLGIYLWPNPWPYPNTYQGEINSLKTWLHNRLAWLDANMPGECYTTAFDDAKDAISIINIYPNPSPGQFTFEFYLQQPSKISLVVHNSLGQVVATLADGVLASGTHQVFWNSGKLPAGVYYYRLQAGDLMVSNKIIKTK